MFNVPNKCVGCTRINNLENSIATPQAAAEAAIGVRIVSMSGAKLELEGGVTKGPASDEYGAATRAMTDATNYALRTTNRINDLTDNCSGLQPGGICGSAG